MAKGVFDKAEVGVACPGCGHESKKQIGWLRTHDEMVCPGCGATVGLDDKDFRAGLDRADKALSDFKRKLKRR